MSNPHFGDTVQFLVYETDPVDPYIVGCEWELWQRMSLMDSVLVCGLCPCDQGGLADTVECEFNLPSGTAYEVWSRLPGSEGQLMVASRREA